MAVQHSGSRKSTRTNGTLQKVPVLRFEKENPNLSHAAHQLYPNNHPPWAKQRRRRGTPTLIRVVDGSPRGVALGANKCVDGSERGSRDTRDTRVPGSAVFQGPLQNGNVMLHGLDSHYVRCMQNKRAIAPCMQQFDKHPVYHSIPMYEVI